MNLSLALYLAIHSAFLLQEVEAILHVPFTTNFQWPPSFLSFFGLDQPKVAQDLRQLLSPRSAVFSSEDARWPKATQRYQAYALPNPQLVIEPGHESDIPKIVSSSYQSQQTSLLIDN